MSSNIPKPLRLYIALVGMAGLGWLAYLLPGVDWGISSLGEMGLFFVLTVVAGSFPLPVSPRVKADVTTAVWFAAALLIGPGEAALAGAAGILTYTVLIRFWGERPQLPWYKHPFNVGQVALAMGLTAVVFDALSTGDGLLTPAVVPAAACMYVVNTGLVSIAASLQLGISPVRIWWLGTRENGLAELSLFAFGFLGAVAYQESPWTVLALLIPVAVIYIAFSRLARTNSRLEEALQRLEALQGRIVGTSKLASVGAISLDLAHQIKNPLAILLGRMEELEDRLDQGSEPRRHLDIAVSAGWRIHELTQTFSAIGQQRWVQLDACELLEEAFAMAGLRTQKRIETRREYNEGSLRVKGNPVLIREALSNVFSNSMDAVGDGGIITIGASQVNGTVVVSISDNGAGIPHGSWDRLFEPFYSTKPNGHGLGLFATKHIVEMHQGNVEIRSVEGEGTCVTVSLPADATFSVGSPEGNSDSLS